jgi:ArsR family transcriptional regulator
MNMKSSLEDQTAQIFSILGNPFRIKLLLEIGSGEACVCHLEAVLEQRQAYISQHLMALRKADLLKTRREGKFIFYQLSDPNILDLLKHAAKLSGLPETSFPDTTRQELQATCCCPHCSMNEQAEATAGQEEETPKF